MEKNPPRLLIVAYTVASLRAHYDDVITTLTRAGVEVSIRYVNERGLTADEYRESLARRGCVVQVNPLGRYKKRDRGDRLALRLRELANLLRFSHPDYHGREWLRDAKFEKAARIAPGPRRWARRLGRLGRRSALSGLQFASKIDRVIPPPQAARAFLAEERPNAVAVVGVVFTPALVDYLKAAAWEGIPTAHWVQSWDNLTNKGLLHFTPDRVFVWNDFQRKELARYHRIPESRACVTGAQTFDHWFNGDKPSSRSEFCFGNGIDPERPLVVYLVSSRQIEPPADVFFLRWLDAIRSSGDPALEDATVLVRPHPTDLEPWLGLERRYPRLAVSPSIAAAPINSPEYRQRFRNELHHASVVVGLNTSGMIDAAILGKPVCTVELPDVPNRQRGTIHFEYLMTVGGGFVQTATSLEEHVDALAELVRKDPYERDERSAHFLQQFIRPYGLDVTPATVFSEEMLRMLQSPSEVRLPSDGAQAIGRLIHRGAIVLGTPLEESFLLTNRRRRRLEKALLRLLKPVRRKVREVRKLLRGPIKYWRGLLIKYRRPIRKVMKQARRPIMWALKYWWGLVLKYRTRDGDGRDGVRGLRSQPVMEHGQPLVLIAARNLALLRGHYEDVIVALVRAGVRVSIRYRNDKGLSAESYAETLRRRGCSVPLQPLPRLCTEAGDLLALRLRLLANLLRFYRPEYQRPGAALLGARLEKAAAGPRRWALRLGRLGSGASSLAMRLASSADRLFPPSSRARRLIANERPDAVVVVDVDRVPELVDVLKAAASERVRTAIWIQSWDNLTTKGLLHFTPDRIFVWNETQREELSRYHKVDARRVCVTGAQTFDHWFNGESPSGRRAFCAQNGLDPERPIILYLASSRLAEVSPDDFFVPWLEAVRASGDPALERATVLVRPHPTNVQGWQSLDDDPALLVSPSTVEAPINSPEFRRRYRDELHHASVAVGLNTSAMIDAAIFGKPVCTVELPELAKGQRGTVHFEYLMTVGGGFVRTASNLDTHLRLLGDLVHRDPYERDERAARFVQAFVRPHGLDVTPSTVFSKEMLRLLESPPEPHLPRPLGRAAGRLLHRAAPIIGVALEAEPLRAWPHLRAPLHKRKLQRRWNESRRSVKRAVRNYRARSRANLKPVRRFLKVRLRGSVRAGLQRVARPGKTL